MTDLEKKKTKLMIQKMDTNILEYEIKIEERMLDIERIKEEIKRCKGVKKDLDEKLK